MSASMDYLMYTARQMASGLMAAILEHQGISSERALKSWSFERNQVHFHDDSQSGIAFNDVQAIQMYKALTGEDLDVPMMASEGYNQHYHTSDFDGGAFGQSSPISPQVGFAIFHPGTSVGGMPWSI